MPGKASLSFLFFQQSIFHIVSESTLLGGSDMGNRLRSFLRLMGLGLSGLRAINKEVRKFIQTTIFQTEWISSN